MRGYRERMPTGRVVFNKWSRKLHRWGAVVSLLPLGVVIATGLLLQLKKDWAWVQPATERGSSVLGEDGEAIGLEAVLEVVRGVSEAGVSSWEDVDRLDVRPDRGIVKVRTRYGWEVQVDVATGEVLNSAARRSDLIESLHDGSFFGNWAKLGVFLPSGLVLAGLWASGVWLWWMPHGARRRRERAEGEKRRAGSPPH